MSDKRLKKVWFIREWMGMWIVVWRVCMHSMEHAHIILRHSIQLTKPLAVGNISCSLVSFEDILLIYLSGCRVRAIVSRCIFFHSRLSARLSLIRYVCLYCLPSTLVAILIRLESVALLFYLFIFFFFTHNL